LRLPQWFNSGLSACSNMTINLWRTTLDENGQFLSTFWNFFLFLLNHFLPLIKNSPKFKDKNYTRLTAHKMQLTDWLFSNI
jgi:hypothetical protein